PVAATPPSRTKDRRFSAGILRPVASRSSSWLSVIEFPQTKKSRATRICFPSAAPVPDLSKDTPDRPFFGHPALCWGSLTPSAANLPPIRDLCKHLFSQPQHRSLQCSYSWLKLAR